MASTLIVETSITHNSPSKESNNPDDHIQSRYVTPGFKPFSYLYYKKVVLCESEIRYAAKALGQTPSFALALTYPLQLQWHKTLGIKGSPKNLELDYIF